MSTTKDKLSELFRARLRMAIDKAGLSQVQVAGAVEVSRGTVSKWLAGTLPRSGELLRLARLLSVSMEWLLEGVEGGSMSEAELETPLAQLGQLPADKLKGGLSHLGLSLREFQSFVEYFSSLPPGPLRLSTMLDKAIRPAQSSPGMTQIENVVGRARRLAGKRGVQSRIASQVGCSRQAVSKWLAGDATPSGEMALRLLQWVKAEEAKQESPGSGGTQPGRQTPKGIQSNESQESGPSKRLPKRKRKASG